MRLLVNENVTGTVIHELGEHGHDVLAVKESMRAEQDEIILARAQAEQRIVSRMTRTLASLRFGHICPLRAGSFFFGWPGAMLARITSGCLKRLRAEQTGRDTFQS